MLVAELLRDPYSHLQASVAGWGYVPDPVDVFFFNWVDAVAQMRHQPGKVRPRPLERPWMTASTREVPPPDPGRWERRAELMGRLGLGGVVEANDEPDGEPQPESD